MAYEAERESCKADIEAAGVRGFLRRASGDVACSFLIESYSALERDGSLIQFGDASMMVPALGLTDVPDAEQDRVVIDDPRPEYAAANGNYRVVTVTPFHPGGVAIFYTLQARK
jgi:hypothetical protein